MTFLIIWLLIGLVSSIVAIVKFRSNGTDRTQELIMAALGPFFGPVVTVLLCLDIIRNTK